MARRRSTQKSDEGRFIAARIQNARRQGRTNAEIADAFGINERTVRKLVSGETSGKRLYKEHVAPTRRVDVRNKSIVRLDLVIGEDEQGNEIIRTVNAKTPLVNGQTPTPFDIFQLPDLQNVAQAEAARMIAQYAGAISPQTLCRRRYCRHMIVDHEYDPAEEGIGACLLCRCPEYVEPRVRVASVRPIVRRNPAKRLVTIVGTIRA